MAIAKAVIVDQLAARIERMLLERAHSNHQDYISLGQVEIDEEAVLETALERIPNLNSWLVEQLMEHPLVTGALEEMRVIVKETAVDHFLYETNPMGYYGLSQKDFV